MNQPLLLPVITQEWSESLPLRARRSASSVILKPPPWSLADESTLMRYLAGLGAVIVVAAVVVLLGPSVSEDNDMLLYFGTLIFLSLRLGVGPTLVACCLSLMFLSLGRAHSGFAIVTGRWEYLVSFALFLSTTNIVSRLSTRVQSEAWKEQQRAESLKFLNEYSRLCGQVRSQNELEQQTRRALSYHLGLEFGAQATDSLVFPGAGGDFLVAVPQQGEGCFWRPYLEAVRTLYLDAKLRLEQADKLRQTVIDQETQRLQSALINSLSHDIQTPLASIMGTFEVLRDQSLELCQDRQSKLLCLGHSQTQRLLNFSRNMLNLGKLEGGALNFVRLPVSMEETVPRALELLAEEDRSRVILNVLTEQAFVLGDRGLLSQIVFNLLDNALKFSPNGEQVEIEVSHSSNGVCLAVSDRGVGVLGPERELIFERFRRGTVPERLPGSGLGLHISRELAALHKGTLWVEARPSGGSRFVLTLPKHNPATIGDFEATPVGTVSGKVR